MLFFFRFVSKLLFCTTTPCARPDTAGEGRVRSAGVPDVRDGRLRGRRRHGNAGSLGEVGRAGRGGVLFGQGHVSASQGTRARHAASKVSTVAQLTVGARCIYKYIYIILLLLLDPDPKTKILVIWCVDGDQKYSNKNLYCCRG